MPVDAELGPIVGVVDACRALEDHARMWLPLYLDRLQPLLNDARPAGDPPIDLSRPVTWRTPVSADSNAPIINDGQLPTVSFVPAGTPSAPRRNGQQWEASWLVDAVVFARGQSYDHTAATVGAYVTALRTAIVQHNQSIVGVDWCVWVGEQVEPLGDPRMSRTIGQGSATFVVGYQLTVDERSAPPEPPSPVDGDVDEWPTVLTTPLTVDTEVP